MGGIDGTTPEMQRCKKTGVMRCAMQIVERGARHVDAQTSMFPARDIF